MGLKSIIKIFEQGNVSVEGLRGTGKDMLFANIIARRKQPYISNTNYHCKDSCYIKLDFSKIDLKNNYENFLREDIIPYDYPYPEKCDIYIADCGIYLPSQYCNQLNNKYPQLPTFLALSRHLGDCNVHYNVQNLNRVWDKLREQSDIFIRTTNCKVINTKIPILKRLFNGLVFQTVYIYDKYQSCIDRVERFKREPIPIFASKEIKAQIKRSNIEAKRRYDEKYGKVKKKLLIYKNKSNYDTRLFKGVLNCEK